MVRIRDEVYIFECMTMVSCEVLVRIRLGLYSFYRINNTVHDEREHVVRTWCDRSDILPKLGDVCARNMCRFHR
jgi:hypothetical protein